MASYISNLVTYLRTPAEQVTVIAATLDAGLVTVEMSASTYTMVVIMALLACTF